MCFFSSRGRHTRWPRDWSSDVCSSDLNAEADDRLLASVVSFDGTSGFGSIWESTDDGATFSQISTVLDEATETGEGLCCATLFEIGRASCRESGEDCAERGAVEAQGRV